MPSFTEFPFLGDAGGNSGLSNFILNRKTSAGCSSINLTFLAKYNFSNLLNAEYFVYVLVGIEVDTLSLTRWIGIFIRLCGVMQLIELNLLTSYLSGFVLEVC